MSRMPASRTLRYAAAAGFGALLFALTMVPLGQLAVYGKDGPVTDPIDFRGPYCAGTALDAGLDPYRIGPIQDCQRAALAVSGLRTSELHVLYAPLPPYALAPFALLAKLPFRL